MLAACWWCCFECCSSLDWMTDCSPPCTQGKLVWYTCVRYTCECVCMIYTGGCGGWSQVEDVRRWLCARRVLTDTSTLRRLLHTAAGELAEGSAHQERWQGQLVVRPLRPLILLTDNNCMCYQLHYNTLWWYIVWLKCSIVVAVSDCSQCLQASVDSSVMWCDVQL